jgi:hypothetical protein
VGSVIAIAACSGEVAEPVPVSGTAGAGPDTANTMTFRQRDAAVVLSDSSTGQAWIASDNYRAVDNWADVAPPESEIDDSSTIDDPTTSADLPRVPPDCTAVPIGQPGAVDDEFGVRAGRATVLRVLDNDPSVDCTSVVIDTVSPLPPEVGTVAIVAGGSAIQVTVPATAQGALPPIDYTVGNGRGGTASAKVLVGVVPSELSKPAERVRRSAATTEVNGTVSYNVLDDFVSPTGDDLYLLAATTDSGDVVSFRPDGTVTYRNTGTGGGTDRTVEVVISDGVEQAPGTLTVAIAPAQSTTPVVYPSFTRAVIGSPAVIHPLRSVVSAATDPVTISTVQPEAGSEAATARLDQGTGAVTVTATAVGSYYFTFEAATGGRAVTGVLRADFVAPDDAARTVVPMTDVAYLTPGGQVVLDPLLNDTDPDGQGLAVREVELPATAPVTAAVVDLHLVQVTAPRTPKGTIVFGYSVFDGATTATGQIRVVPVPAPKKIPPPLASPVTATVRAGDAVTIPVSRFASAQDGTPVTAELDPVQLAGLPGLAFSTGDTIRYLAPADATPGTVTFSYTAVAGSSTPLQPVQTVSTVTITVATGDPTRNTAPNPPPAVTARVFAGGAISISVPLAGIDPDGDWVVLQSLEQPEAPLGEVAIAGPDTLSYQGFGSPGVDRIRYEVADPAGLTVTGEVTVLVVEPVDSARPPVAPDLAVAVRPGASIRIDPLASVVDPGGQHVELATPAFVASPGLQVEVDDQSLIVTGPVEPTVASLRYSVINAKGLTASGSVKVTVSGDAPLPPPMAKDIFVRPADLAANKNTVDVDVSGSITNGSGRKADLVIEVDPLSAAQATKAAPQVIRVNVTAARQVVAYRVTDGNGATAMAFIVVPPAQQLVGPQLIGGAGPIQVAAGQSVDVAIGDYVTVGGGGSPTIAESPTLRSTQGSAMRTSATTLTLLVPSTAGGAAAVYVPVDDGAGSVIVLSLPVQIEPRLVPPPKLDSTELQIEAGTSGSVDLAALTTTSDELQAGSISYAVGVAPAGLQISQDGSVIVVTAAADVPRGTQVALPIQVVDGDGRDGKATLTISVTGSRKPLATVIDQQVAEGRGGVEVTADLLTGSFDPVGLGLTVTGVEVVEGGGGIAAGPTLTGSTVRLTPAAGFVGDIVIAGSVIDGTKDPDRVVTTNLRVSIQDRPSAPGTPAVVDGTLGARAVQLAWTPSDANGAAISAYTVTGGGISQDCPDSTCVIGGLTPGQPYIFVVTAENTVGVSGASAPSVAIIPDTSPSAPGAPSARYVGRGQLQISWSVPTGDFTPVTGATVQVLRGDQVVEVRENPGNPLSLDGLELSAPYRFQVRVSNQQGTSEWSAPSDPIVPSDRPSPPSELKADFVYDGGRRGIEISWKAPQDNGGEAITGYRVLLDGTERASGGGDFRSTLINVDSTDEVSVTVIAQNNRGDSPPTDAKRVTPFSTPSQVTGLKLSPGDGSLRASWNPAESPGATIAGYDYRLGEGGWVSAGSDTSTTITGLTNGDSYDVQVRACNDRPGFGDEVRCGPASVKQTETPYGDLGDLQITAVPSEEWTSSVTVAWNIPLSGNGRPLTNRSIEVTGDLTTTIDAGTKAAGTWTQDIGFGKSIFVTARYCVANDVCRTATADVTTPAVFSLATVALPPLVGVCGLPQQYPGEWLTDATTCGSGVWVVAPTPIAALCRQSGVSYPEVPAGNPAPPPIGTVTQWYLDNKQNWFRGAAVTPDSKVPSC